MKIEHENKRSIWHNNNSNSAVGCLILGRGNILMADFVVAKEKSKKRLTTWEELLGWVGGTIDASTKGSTPQHGGARLRAAVVVLSTVMDNRSGFPFPPAGLHRVLEIVVTVPSWALTSLVLVASKWLPTFVGMHSASFNPS